LGRRKCGTCCMVGIRRKVEEGNEKVRVTCFLSL
jgi:hypothetical protein